MEAVVVTLCANRCYCASGRIRFPLWVAQGGREFVDAFSTICYRKTSLAVGLRHPLHLRSTKYLPSQGAGLITRSCRPRFLIQSATLPAERSTEHEKFADQRMAVGPSVSLSARTLGAYGKNILTEVPDNVSVIPDLGSPDVGGSFIGASAVNADSSHTFRLGIFSERRFLALYRFKLWWMTQKVGVSASEIPAETQFLLLEVVTDEPSGPQEDGRNIRYVVLLPLLDESFRSSFEDSSDGHLLLHCQSGDSAVQSCSFPHAVYILAGDNPYQVISDAVRAVEKHTDSFVRREKKQLPASLEYFGWCTWDAYYTGVDVDKVHRGLASLSAGGTPPRFLIIDDGWQSTGEDGKEDAVVSVGTQYASRLTDFRENDKFKQLKGAALGGALVSLGEVVQELKATHHLRYVYVWHALLGYWGGVQPCQPTEVGPLDRYQSTLVFPIHSAGVLLNQPNMAEDSLTVTGVGVVPPSEIAAFYDAMHAYLAEVGVDGVKVDAQSIVETLGAGYGGRVRLARVYHEALEKSVAKNFPDNGVIACMSHHTDSLYSAKQTAVIRASDDFWPCDPASHSVHVASVAYNSLFLGEFMQPDWDMFQSRHPAAAYHAAARAVGGCAVYVSDKPGEHDFQLLKKLVLPDGSVLRALLPGRPTRDSLFEDPSQDSKSMLKIWNMNRHTGLLGAFNCQGATWCRVERKYVIHNDAPGQVTGSIRALDVDFLPQLAGPDWMGDSALFAFRRQELTILPCGAVLPLTLEQLQYELFTVTPIKNFGCGVEFAPIGLVDMYNCGGSIISVEYNIFQVSTLASREVGTRRVDKNVETGVMVTIFLRGCGLFGAYCTYAPSSCQVNDILHIWQYNSTTQMLQIIIPEEKDMCHSLYIYFDIDSEKNIKK